MADYKVTDTELTATANAIRAKTGDSAAIEWKADKGFADKIGDIVTGTLTIGTATAAGDQTGLLVYSDILARPKFFGFEAWSGTNFLSSVRYVIGGTVERIEADGRYKIHSPAGSSTGKLAYTEYVYATYEDGTLTLTTENVSQNTPVFGRNITYRLYYVY